MTRPKRYDRIAFVASAGTEAQAALAQLTSLYGNHHADDSDVVVALGGDGLMLQTLHAHMRSGKPIYGMHRGTVGFLMNEFATHDLRTRLPAQPKWRWRTRCLGPPAGLPGHRSMRSHLLPEWYSRPNSPRQAP